MKNILGIGTLLVAVFLMAGCGPTDKSQGTSTDTSATNDATNTTDTQATSGTITAVVPEGWTKVEGSTIPVQYMKGTASFMAKTEYFKSTNLDDVVKEALAVFQESFNGVTVTGEAQSIKVDGLDARKFVFTCNVSQIPMKYMYVYAMADGGGVYSITFGDLADTFDSLSADYESILSQIKF